MMTRTETFTIWRVAAIEGALGPRFPPRGTRQKETIMGVFDFVKEAGAKVGIGDSKEDKAKDASIAAASVDAAKKAADAQRASRKTAAAKKAARRREWRHSFEDRQGALWRCQQVPGDL